MLNTPITTKDLLIGLFLGIVLTLFSGLMSPTNQKEEFELVEEKIFNLERQVSSLKGENESYKRWIDSTMVLLNQDQRNELLRKM